MTVMRSLTVVIVAVLISVSSAKAQVLEDAAAAYDKKDYVTALRLYRPLAEQGDAKAQTYLGIMYDAGHGVPQDDAEAVKWWRKAAEQGNALAEMALGRAYRFGLGVQRDDAEAVKWWRKAAEQDDAGALFTLGLNYEVGDGVLQDYLLAYMWMNLAAAHGERGAAISRDKLAAKMTPDQIAEAQRLAREWKPTK
jgi:TPR repeat protein